MVEDGCRRRYLVYRRCRHGRAVTFLPAGTRRHPATSLSRSPALPHNLHCHLRGRRGMGPGATLLNFGSGISRWVRLSVRLPSPHRAFDMIGLAWWSPAGLPGAQAHGKASSKETASPPPPCPSWQLPRLTTEMGCQPWGCRSNLGCPGSRFHLDNMLTDWSVSTSPGQVLVTLILTLLYMLRP